MTYVDTTDWPFVSFVIPFYNERESIASCVESLLDIDYPKEKLEIILVNDASTDGSDIIVKQFCRNHPSVKMAQNNTRQGPAAGLNLGINLASGEIIAHFAADAYVEQQYLRKTVAHFSDPHVAAVIPHIEALGDERGSRLFRLDAPISAPGFLLARKKALVAVGLYDTQFYRKLPGILGGFKIYFREDTDLVLSLIDNGYRVIGEPSATAFHPIDRISLRDIPRLGLRHCQDSLLLKRHLTSAKTALKVAFFRFTYWFIGWLSITLIVLTFLASALNGTLIILLYGLVFFRLYRSGGMVRLVSPILLYLFLTMVVVGRLFGSAREKYFVM